MKESMPFHDEMSDSVFMATPIVAKAGALTGESRYFDMAARMWLSCRNWFFGPMASIVTRL